MRIWSLSTHRDGWELTIEEVPDWAHYVGLAFEELCELTGGRLGGHNLGDWAWKVPVGPPRWDHTDNPADPWLENSLASKLSDIESWFVNLAYRRRRKTVRISLSVEEARLINPEFVDDWEQPDAATWKAEEAEK